MAPWWNSRWRFWVRFNLVPNTISFQYEEYDCSAPCWRGKPKVIIRLCCSCAFEVVVKRKLFFKILPVDRTWPRWFLVQGSLEKKNLFFCSTECESCVSVMCVCWKVGQLNCYFIRISLIKNICCVSADGAFYLKKTFFVFSCRQWNCNRWTKRIH